MKLKFWGTRGSCAAPFTDRSEFGGNTSCVSLRSGNCWLVLDGGTGIIPLASEIRQAALESEKTCCVKILISHFHLDHIVGLPMFLAALPKNTEVTLYTVPDPDAAGAIPYAEKLISLIGPPLWPVTLTDVCRQLQFADLARNAESDIGSGITIRTLSSNHPNNTSIYRIRWQGRDIVYGLDCEITDDFEETYIAFAKGCNCLLYDGAYTDEDYVRCIGFGHSAMSKAAVIAQKTDARCVYIMHYDYAYTDDMLRETEASFNADHNRILFSREGQSMDL